MPYRRLFVFVEGVSDERLFEKVLKPLLVHKYDDVKSLQWARTKKEKTLQIIHSVKSMCADYLFFTDFDESLCVTQKRQDIRTIYSNKIDIDRIIVVKKEIESWYKAGLTDDNCDKFKISKHTHTDGLTKEAFNEIIPRQTNRLNFMLEILNCFSVECAIQKNNSFKYFYEKYCC